MLQISYPADIFNQLASRYLAVSYPAGQATWPPHGINSQVVGQAIRLLAQQ